MNIVILGAGKTGAFVASTLTQEGHHVTLIDKDAKTLERVSRDSDVAIFHAVAPSWKLFEDLSENKPDLFFAATGDDETNLVSCAIAKNLGFPKTLARIKAPDYLNHSRLSFGKLFFVDHFIAPEVLAAQDLCKALIHSNDLAMEHFAHGAIQMRTVQIPEKWDRGQVPIKDLSLPEDLIAGLIHRKLADQETILIPHGDDFILPGDQVTLVGRAKVMHTLHEIFHSPQHRIKSVVLVGGTPVAIHLAQLLMQQKVSVRIIESDPTVCEELATILPQITVINRDARDPQLLQMEGIQDADALVCCTHRDETNLLIASLAKQIGCTKTIAQVTDTRYIPLLEKLDVIPALSARINIANRIRALLDQGTTLSVASLSFDTAKIIEMRVAPSSKLVGVPLSQLGTHFPKDSLIALIESQGQISVGRGDKILRGDDVVIAICHPSQVATMQSLFH